MRRTLLCLLTTLLMTLGVSAQKGSLYLHMSQSGTTTTYNLADISKVHFAGNTMDIVTAGATDSYAYSPLNTAIVSADPDPQVDYTNGFGTDGSYEVPSQDDSGYFLIDNGGKLFWLAEQVNNGVGTAYNAKLTADIDLEDRAWTPMGTAAYTHGGEFDGQGHSIAGLNVNTDAQYAAFIGYHSGTTSVHDFTIAGSVTYTGNTADHCVAGVIAFNAGVNMVEDIVCSVNIETPNATANVRIAGIVAREENAGTINRCTYSGTNNGYGTAMQVAGIVGMAGTAGNNMKVTNCLFTGTLKATNTGAYVGGIAGYIGKSGTSFRNCLSAGSYEVPAGATRTGALIGAGNGNVTATTFDNCYILTGQSEKGSTSGISATISYTAVNDAQLANGSITAALGDNWIQGAATPCPYDPAAQPSGHTHTFVNGFCTDAACTAPYQEPAKDSENYYLIDNGGKLFWLAEQVNEGTGAAYNAKLTADIDLENRLWTPMGDDTNKHTGIFDGQGHSITGLNIQADASVKFVGFIGYHNGTNDICNLKISGNVVGEGASGAHFISGLVGQSSGNHKIQDVWCSVNVSGPTGTSEARVSGLVVNAQGSTINRCVYDGTVNGYATSLQTTGLLGWADANNTTVTNCLFAGKLISTGIGNGSAYMGGIVGYSPSTRSGLVFANNLSIGTLESPTDATRTGALSGRNTTDVNSFTNNYILQGQPIAGTASRGIPTATEVTTAQLTDGTLPAKLSANNWVQGATYPIPQENSAITEDDMTVDGIKYEITGANSVKVTYPNDAQPSSSNPCTYSGEITIPATVTIKGTTYNVTAIGDYAFHFAPVTSLTLPEGIVSLGYKAIYQTQLTEITVPNSVTTMDYEALGYNKQLVTIRFGENIAANTWGDKLCIYGDKKYEVYLDCNAVPKLRSYTFSFTGATVHVRPTMYAAFKADVSWNVYDIVGDLWVEYTYDDLQGTVNTYEALVPTGDAVGTDPGCYTAASTQALADAIAAGRAVDESASLEQLNNAINDILTAYNSMQVIELQEGYYYIESIYKPGYALVTDAATAATQGIKTAAVDAGQEKFYFRLTRHGGNWYVQNVESGMYMGTAVGGNSNGNSVSVTSEPQYEQVITWITGGAYKIQDIYSGTSATYPYRYYNYGVTVYDHNDAETRIHWHFHPAAPGMFDLDFNLENGRVRGFVHDFEYSASDASKVGDYKKNPPARLDQPVPATVFWTRNTSSTAQELTWSTDATFADATTVNVDNSAASYEIYNLIPGKTYYYKVSATVDGAPTELFSSSFTTSGQVRMIKADGISNIRDLGGWPTESGYNVSYGRIFRGAAFTSTTITPEGIAAVRDAGVRAELDLRDGSQDGSMSASLLGSDVEYNRIMLAQTASHMGGLTGSKSQYIACVKYVLNCVKNDKPVYFHCAIGRDRTGTLAFLLEGVLGMSKSDIYKDYELTNFSNLNTPCSKGQLDDMFTMIEALEGTTLEDKFRTYLTTEFGISSDDIDAFRTKMLNLPPVLTPAEVQNMVGEAVAAGATALDLTSYTFAADVTAADMQAPGTNLLVIVDPASGIFGQNIVGEGLCQSLVLTDGEPFVSEEAITAATASYIRTLPNGNWYSAVLPFDFSVPADVEVVNNAVVDGAVVTLTKVEGVVAANTPFLFRKSEGGEVVFKANNATVSTASQPASGALLATYVGLADGDAASKLALNTDGSAFVLATEPTSLSPFRAYINAESDDQVLTIEIDDPMGVNGVRNEEPGIRNDLSNSYDLQGRKVNTQGAIVNAIIISNGKKILMKK